ncbi:MAG: hypothetical protein ACLRMJ_08175 [Alistipes finegoldii]
MMARDKLKAYQTTYAEAMAKYGLQRGIEDRKQNIYLHNNITARYSSARTKSPSRSRISKNSDKP